MQKLKIPYKFPSFNDYVNACRKNKYSGATMKKNIEKDISYFINQLPKFDNPVKIHFHWIEGNKRRDYDNICFAKKFILDGLVRCGKLKDDNRKCVTAFTDSFSYSDDGSFGVVLDIEEMKEV